MKSILVIGIGRFGKHLCEGLVKNGNDVMIKANNTTVWRNEKLYEIKQKDIFVNIVEGIFFDIEKE